RAVAAAAEDHANLPRGIINEAKPGARRRSPPHPQIRPSGPRQLPVVVLLLARVGYMTWAPAKQVSLAAHGVMQESTVAAPWGLVRPALAGPDAAVGAHGGLGVEDGGADLVASKAQHATG